MPLRAARSRLAPPPALQLIVIYTCLILLARNLSGKTAPALVLQVWAGALLGGALGTAVLYISRAAAGGDWSGSVAQASARRCSRALQARSAAAPRCVPTLRPLSCTASPQAAALLALSSPVAFILTVARFSGPRLQFPMLFATLVFALSGEPSRQRRQAGSGGRLVPSARLP